jgi:hypothetical protein
MQASQDIAIGGRVAKTQYQYTLVDADANELNTGRRSSSTVSKKCRRSRTSRPTKKTPARV